MSQLRSMITEVTSFDPDDLSAEELAAEISEALHGKQLLETAVAGWVRNLSDRVATRSWVTHLLLPI